MKKLYYTIVILILILSISPHLTIRVSADNFMEYYFIPTEDNNISGETGIPSEYTDILNKLPPEIKKNLPEEFFSGDINDISKTAETVINYSYIKNKLIDLFVNVLIPSIKDTTAIIGLIIIASLANTLTDSLAGKNNGKFTELIINSGISIVIIGEGMTALRTLESFKTIICEIMNGMIPIIGALFTLSGNPGTAAIQSAGFLSLVSLCQSIFSSILMPSVRICLVLSIVGSIFTELNIKPITTLFKNITTAIITAAMTLFSFTLGLQNSFAQSTDTFAFKSIKFAIGSLIPIIGGTLSDSLGTIGTSLSVIKTAGGSVVIIIVILLVAPTLLSLIIRRFMLSICKSIAGVLHCTNTETLLGDLGGITSMMIAFAGAISASFIYSLMLFTKSSLALSS